MTCGGTVGGAGTLCPLLPPAALCAVPSRPTLPRGVVAGDDVVDLFVPEREALIGRKGGGAFFGATGSQSRVGAPTLGRANQILL